MSVFCVNTRSGRYELCPRSWLKPLPLDGEKGGEVRSANLRIGVRRDLLGRCLRTHRACKPQYDMQTVPLNDFALLHQLSHNPSIPHDSSRIWLKFVLFSAPAISLHTRAGH